MNKKKMTEKEADPASKKKYIIAAAEMASLNELKR